MNIKEFNRLPKERQIELLQRRLGEMKSQKLKTTDFTNDEFNFSWPSQKIKELGYWYDQTNYCCAYKIHEKRFERICGRKCGTN